MLLSQLAGVKSWLPSHSTSTDTFWQKRVSLVSSMDIQLFYARAGLKSNLQDARAAINLLQDAVIAGSFEGEVKPSAAIIMHEQTPEPFLVDELVDGLAKLKITRRRACLYALETRQSPQEAADLTWIRVQERKQISPLARETLQASAQTRHLKLPYVFWEWATPTIATPLLKLEWSITQAFGCSWPELTTRYERMIKLNRGAEAASLMELAEYGR
jgi:hypothetical protein